MRGFDIAFDEARGLLLCRIEPGLEASGGESLLNALTEAVATARRAGALRMLWDNRVAPPIPADAAHAIRAMLEKGHRPGDRIAVIVPNSIAKVQARPRMTEASELFASENAALTWLRVAGSSAAA